MASADDSAPVILGNVPGSFARGVMAERNPALIQQVREASPYGPAQHRALDTLLLEITDGVIEPLAPDAPGHARWQAWGGAHFGRSWFDVPFLWAESYFYRKLLAATDYFAPGAWQGIDPFAPFKQAELLSTTVDDELAALDVADAPDGSGTPGGRDTVDPAYALLHASLWGNRADLGFRISSGTADDTVSGPTDDATDHTTDDPKDTAAGPDPRLVADDSALLWPLLPTGSPGSPSAAIVHLIADNAGRELIPDLVLLDHLLRTGRAARAVLHVKPHPYYVSDATMADVIDALRRLGRAAGYAAVIGRRLWSALTTGQLAVRAHDFFCAPLPFAAMPAELRDDLAGGTVTLVKGDLNYRRLVGDQHWPATTPFADRTGYFPGPVTALRTLKSDVVVGLDERTLTSLERSGQAWRTSGTHALIQTSRSAG